ncbi:MAG: glycosyltransferase [Acidimicrobiales bacterium]
MIGFACCINNDRQYAELVAPRLFQQVGDHETVVVELRDQTDIHNAYNQAREVFLDSGVEFGIFMHQDVELQSDAIFERLRGIFSDPTIGVIGPIGASRVSSLRWWEGEMRGRVTDTNFDLATDDPFGDVDALDGMFLAVSRTTLERVSFDPGYGGFHGYDVDLCFSARAVGLHVVTADLPMHHHTKGGYGDIVAYARAQAYFESKWKDAIAERGELELSR